MFLVLESCSNSTVVSSLEDLELSPLDRTFGVKIDDYVGSSEVFEGGHWFICARSSAVVRVCFYSDYIAKFCTKVIFKGANNTTNLNRIKALGKSSKNTNPRLHSSLEPFIRG